jgi:hypothetical protein
MHELLKQLCLSHETFGVVRLLDVDLFQRSARAVLQIRRAIHGRHAAATRGGFDAKAPGDDCTRLHDRAV